MRSAIPRICLLLGAACCLACGNSSAPGGDEQPAANAVQLGIPDWSSDAVGADSLVDSLTIQLHHLNGIDPYPRVWLRFAASSGTIAPIAARTDAGGQVAVAWRLARPQGTTEQLKVCLADIGGGACRAASQGLISHSPQGMRLAEGLR